MTQVAHLSKNKKINCNDFLTPKQAATFASEYLGKNVTSNNIIYLLNYGKIANHSTNPKENLIDKNELKAYYDTSIKSKQDLAHPLSFANFKEAQTTKHIHRLHPYKGKFIPQLVEYFLDSHADFLKEDVFFHKNDIVLDPFCGSGTTLCVANELGMHAIGVDISHFNTLLSNAKIKNYDLQALATQINTLIKILENHISQTKIIEFENTLNTELSLFNQKYFPNKDFKRAVALKNIDEKTYSAQKLQEFLPIYENLIKQFDINIHTNTEGNFFEKWYFDSIKQEILLLKNEILKADKDIQDILMIILSRTARSCRATTHSDLATLTQPINKAYYCSKHGRICKPLFSVIKWFKSYSNDTLKRLKEFNALKTNTFQICLNGDSTNINLKENLQDGNFQSLLEKQKIAGIFSSPPYVGLIDYHEQHAYAYDIFDLKRKDEYEIGSLSEGQSKNAQEKYVNKIADVLLNAKPFLKQDYNIFLVANDKFNLYEKIAKKANMQIIKRYDRAVINRSEKDKNKYSESIFHLKELK
ncbi:restriction endonuclease subunit M [Campylobacter sp. MIT 12-5580]|nr:restriction endonuclease subunit M [Campylobacter sp. MIT 12-5580]